MWNIIYTRIQNNLFANGNTLTDVENKCMVQFSSVQSLSGVRLCDPMNLSTPGLPVHHQLQKFTQTHAHRVSDVIQPSHPLSSPSPPPPNPSQHQGLFQWVNSLPKGEIWGGVTQINQELGINTLLYIAYIANKDLLYSPRNSSQYSVRTYMGK